MIGIMRKRREYLCQKMFAILLLGGSFELQKNYTEATSLIYSSSNRFQSDTEAIDDNSDYGYVVHEGSNSPEYTRTSTENYHGYSVKITNALIQTLMKAKTL